MSYTPAKKKRRWVGPVIVLGVLAGLIAAAFFVAEGLARDAAGAVISRPIKNSLGTTSKVHVDLGEGIFLLQAAKGRINNVTISTEGLPVGDGTASLVLVTKGLPLDTGGTVTAVDARLSLSAEAMQAVVPEGSTVDFAGTQFTVTSQTDLGLGPVPVVASVTPSAAEGLVALEVTGITLNGEAIDLAAAQAGSYGPAAAALATPAPLCVNPYLPASLKLTGAQVKGSALLLTFAGEKVSLGGLSTKGACPVAGE